MPEHYQRNVISVYKWCNHCNQKTPHRVDAKRIGNCMNIHSDGLSKKQEAKLRQETKQFELDKRNEKQNNLFEE